MFGGGVVGVAVGLESLGAFVGVVVGSPKFDGGGVVGEVVGIDSLGVLVGAGVEGVGSGDVVIGKLVLVGWK